MVLFIEVLSLIPRLGWDEEFGNKLGEIESKAQVPQAHHPAKVLDVLKEPSLGTGLQERSVPERFQFLNKGTELLCVCVCV